MKTRPAYVKYLKPHSEPWYSLYDIKNYTFAPWKVVWTRVGNDIRGAVVSFSKVAQKPKPILPIETAVLAPFHDEEEAHYFCSVLNSQAWRFVIISTAVHGTGGFGSPNVLKKARIPSFEAEGSVQIQLSQLSKQAHELAPAAYAGDDQAKKELQVVEAEMDEAAAKLWGLAAAESSEIKRSLKELRG